MQLADQQLAQGISQGTESQRRLGAQLLLSEVLEYLIYGLGVTPEFNGTKITKPDDLQYVNSGSTVNTTEMLDGLSDVAYTMYWNALAFGLPLEEAFELVCDNNLQKFVLLENWTGPIGPLSQDQWDLDRNISWPDEVVGVSIVKIGKTCYGVGKDKRGKVRKPSSFKAVQLDSLLVNSL